MFIEVYDDDTPAVVWLFAGTSNTPTCHQRWLQSMPKVAAAVGERRGAGLLIIDDGNPPPPASARNGIGGVVKAIRTHSPLAVVTTSAIARTVLTGIRFSGVVKFPLKGFADVDDALRWLSKEAGPAAAAILPELVAEARARATATATATATTTTTTI